MVLHIRHYHTPPTYLDDDDAAGAVTRVSGAGTYRFMDRSGATFGRGAIARKDNFDSF